MLIMLIVLVPAVYAGDGALFWSGAPVEKKSLISLLLFSPSLFVHDTTSLAPLINSP